VSMPKRCQTSSLFLLLLLALLAFFLPASDSVSAAKLVDPMLESSIEASRRRSLLLTLSVRNTSADFLPAAALHVVTPLQDTPWQQVHSLQATQPYEHVALASGEQALRFMLNLAPYASREITLRLEAELWPSQRRDYQQSPRLEDLASEPAIESTHPEIVARAASLRAAGTATTTLEAAQQIYQYVADLLEHSAYEPSRRGALFALQHKRGDCSEAADLFVALARAQRIPARVRTGFVLGGNARLESRAYHSWAEFYDGAEWHLADATLRRFGQAQDEYLAFGQGEAAGAEGRVGLFWSDPRLSVTLAGSSVAASSEAGSLDG
jgi:transglutaminase-like putative cysteine protease